MKTRYSTALATAGALVCATAALAQQVSQPSATNGTVPVGVTIPGSSVVNAADAGQRAHTNLQILNFDGGAGGTPRYYGPPFAGAFYETPASIACIYGLQSAVTGCNPYAAFLNPNGGRKNIAIVDAYDDPNASLDLGSFSAQFGVPAPNSTSFIVLYAPFGGPTPGSCAGPATRPLSAKGTGWDVEESLDIEWAHAMAPLATLYLVEAQSNSFSDLLCAVSTANKLLKTGGGGEVSMSWGSGEFAQETNMDPVFMATNVVYFASSGDAPGTSYPSTSPYVVSVGGTTLSRNAVSGDVIMENVWQYTGGGQSVYEKRPAYQSGIATSTRATPDISSDANPYTGVWVYDSLTDPALGVWYVVGGTSVSSPTWAGIVNAAGPANGFAASSHAELTRVYGDGGGDFNDITLGSCGVYMGNFAAPGWDFCSGRGSPRTYSGK